MNNKTNNKENTSYQNTILQNTYLGNKGYTILKTEMSIKQQLSLKEMLMVKPYVPGSPVQVQKTFPAYRESEKKYMFHVILEKNCLDLLKILKLQKEMIFI